MSEAAKGERRAPRKAVVDFVGRGRNGKSTGAMLAVLMALDEGREPLIADANANATLAARFPWASRPPSDDVADQMEWFTDILGEAAEKKRSLVLDLGPAAEVVRRQHGLDFDLAAYCEFKGFSFLSAFFAGPSREDLDYVVEMVRSGIPVSRPAVLFGNEALVTSRKNAQQAFGWWLEAAEFQPGGVLSEAGVRPARFPYLPFMDLLTEKGLGLQAAIEGKPGRDGKRMDEARQFQVQQGVAFLRSHFAKLGIAERMP